MKYYPKSFDIQIIQSLYVACLYPEGNLSDDYNIFFQHEEVGKVLHMGYESDLDEKMQEILNKAAS